LAEPFDVVTVADFSGKSAHVFEARSLLFLASWLGNAGQARDYPLHLVCIGEPPDNVRTLARKAGARLTVHEPLVIGQIKTANKLRGFEVKGETRRVLLLDTDIVFLGDLSPLAELSDVIAAAPSGYRKMPEAVWERIYPALGLEAPKDRMHSLWRELGMPPPPKKKKGEFESETEDPGGGRPYFNGGVVFAPWNSDLGTVWAGSMQHIAQLFQPGERGWEGVHVSDQAALALAIERLKARGFEFRRLPDAFHARWQHLYSGSLMPDEMKIFHATAIMRRVSSSGALTKGDT